MWRFQVPCPDTPRTPTQCSTKYTRRWPAFGDKGTLCTKYARPVLFSILLYNGPITRNRYCRCRRRRCGTPTKRRKQHANPMQCCDRFPPNRVLYDAILRQPVGRVTREIDVACVRHDLVETRHFAKKKRCQKNQGRLLDAMRVLDFGELGCLTEDVIE